MLDIKKVLVLDKNIVLRGVAEKYWALNVESGNQYRLNEVSCFILEQFRNPTAVKDMLEAVLTEYDVAKEQLVTDCDVIINFAIDKGILKEVKI